MTRANHLLSLAPLLGLIAGCSATDATESSSVLQTSPACDADACTDPAPAGPNHICTDGTVAGPACVAVSDVTCGWTIAQCPLEPIDPPVVCNDCSDPRPDAPSQLCKDGTVAGPTCVATYSGACIWTITQCPQPQPTDCTADGCPAGQYCETNCYPCDAPDPKTPCDSLVCQSTCAPS